MADSRPLPGPCTRTCTRFTPAVNASRAHCSAATVAGEQAGREAVTLGVRRVHVRVQGPGSGRESAIQALVAAGLQVKSIKDVTPIPHNGCRPPKRRRV